MHLPRPSLLWVFVLPVLILVVLFVVVQCDVRRAVDETSEELTPRPEDKPTFGMQE